MVTVADPELLGVPTIERLLPPGLMLRPKGLAGATDHL
jgi:hypothetical protein